MAEVKHLTCSMTRANKIISALREGSAKKKPSRYSCVIAEPKYGLTLTHICYYEPDVQERIEEIRAKHTEETMKRRLISKLKNRLFSLNVHYGINDIMSEIDLLRTEKQKLTEIIEDHEKNNYMQHDVVKSIIKPSSGADYKPELTWHIGAFDINDIKAQVKVLTKRISALDEKRDMANIQNSFSVDLTPEEYTMLDLD